MLTRPLGRNGVVLLALVAASSLAWAGWRHWATDEWAANTLASPGPDASIVGARKSSGHPVASTAPTAMLESNAIVLAVIDGDTMEVAVGGRRETVRFLGIDTPEKTGGFLPPECGGDTATRRTAELLPPGTEVHLQRDTELRDRYDRLLAYVYRAADGLFVNRYLVLDGYAGTMHFDPNVTHREVLDAAEASARDARRGIWAHCGGPNQRLADAG